MENIPHSRAHGMARAAEPLRRHTLAMFDRPKVQLVRFRQWRRRRLGRWVRPLAFLGFLGPGLVAANAGNDAGAIITYSSDGAAYGYNLLWMMVVVTVSLVVVQEMCARMGAATGQGLSDLIRERFGVRGASFAMLTLLVANTLITISEFAGLASAAELFGISKYIVVPFAALAIWILVTRGSYARVERVFLFMTLAFFAYPIAALAAHPLWGDVARRIVAPQVHLTGAYLLLFVGTVGTTITPYMQLYIQSSVAEKGVSMDHYGAELADTYVGSIFADVVAAFIIIATAATVFAASHGVGVALNTPLQAAQALTPILGQYAPLIFGIGLIGASLLAAAVLPLATAYAITESFGFERGVSQSFRDAPIFNGLFTGILAIGALVALVPGLPLFGLIVVAQAVNGVLLPILLVFILILVNDERIMGKHVNTRVQNMIAWGSTLLLSMLSVLMIASTILPAIGVPFLAS